MSINENVAFFGAMMRDEVRAEVSKISNETAKRVAQNAATMILRELQARGNHVGRERWRQLVLLVKAKLEAIALGLSTVEREFLADVYLPDGRTVHQALQDGLSEMYKSGTLPPLLGPAR